MANVDSRSCKCPTTLLGTTGILSLGASFTTGLLFGSGIFPTPIVPLSFGAYGVLGIGTSLMVHHIRCWRNNRTLRDQMVATVDHLELAQDNPALELEAEVNVRVNAGEQVVIDVDVENSRDDSNGSSSTESITHQTRL